MKNLYPKAVEKLLFLKRSLKAIFLKWLNSLKKDFSFYNNHTELLAIWTVLFIAIAGLFVLAIKSNILVMFLLFIFAVIIMFTGALAAVYYLHALKYQNKKRLLPKTHTFLNKSFKFRALFRFVKIYRISFLGNFIKNFRHLTKRGFKFAS